MSELQKNYFDILGMPVQFSLDLALLDQHYRTLQAEVHPDRFAAASAGERLQSMHWATLVNEAYQALKHPSARARYLLQLQGVDTAEESNTSMPMDFLMLQMEWREAIEEAFDARDIDGLDALLKQMRQENLSLQSTLQQTLDQDRDWLKGAELVRKLSFIDKIRADVSQKISQLEDE